MSCLCSGGGSLGSGILVFLVLLPELPEIGSGSVFLVSSIKNGAGFMILGSWYHGAVAPLPAIPELRSGVVVLVSS